MHDFTSPADPADRSSVTVAVAGFGTMGGGIAHTCARAGFRTVVLEADADRLAAGRATVEASVARDVARGELSDEGAAAALARLHGTTEVAELADAALVIEAITEDETAKVELLGRLDATVGPDALVATNTSALSVTALGSSLSNPSRFGGLHFFSPVPRMALVEVVRSLTTSAQTVAQLEGFVAAIGKEPIVVEDRPGFLVNHLLLPYLNQALREHDGELRDADAVDRAIELGLGYPVGPLQLVDHIGLDTLLAATTAVHRQTGEARFAPPPLLQRLVEAGRLGVKSGAGVREVPA